MRVLHVASECVPFVKTGGLADVVGALPAALAGAGVAVRVMLPGYPALAGLAGPGAAMELGEIAGGPARIVEREAAGIALLVLEAPHLFVRPGGPYQGPDRRDWPDNAARFAALARAAARAAADPASPWRFDLLHAHDWQAGLAPAFLAHGGHRVPSVLTVHNMAFQGNFPAETFHTLGLPPEAWSPEGVEYWGQVSFLKAGLVHADRITTVSPTYARELRDPRFGMGLEGVIAAREGVVSGILNGVDTALWNPETDPHLPAPYSAADPSGKAASRDALLARFGLVPGPGPLFGLVSRLSHQKGIDLVLEALPALLAAEGRLALLGSGDAALEEAARAAAAAHPGRVTAVIGHDEPLSHLLIAGADAILVPSRFEPCGLTQLYGLRYGSLPVAARTGGLADTVIDANEAALAAGVATGFLVEPGSAAALAHGLGRAAAALADPALRAGLVRAAMAQPVGWERSAAAYARLYRALAGS